MSLYIYDEFEKKVYDKQSNCVVCSAGHVAEPVYDTSIVWSISVDYRNDYDEVYGGWRVRADLVSFIESVSQDKVTVIGLKDSCFNDRYYFIEIYIVRKLSFLHYAENDVGFWIIKKKHFCRDSSFLHIPESKFAHLNVRSMYSIMSGYSHIEEIALQAKRFKMPAACLTDLNSAAGVHRFIKFCRLIDIKPVVGCELTFYDESVCENKDDRSQIILLADNGDGVAGIFWFIKNCSRNGYVDFFVLNSLPEGVICLSGGRDSIISQSILNGKSNKYVETIIEKFVSVFCGNYYIQLIAGADDDSIKINRKLNHFLDDHKYVVTGDVRYMNKNDYNHYNIWCAIDKKEKIYNELDSKKQKEQWFLSVDEIKYIFDKYHTTISWIAVDAGINTVKELVDSVRSYKLDKSLVFPEVNVDDFKSYVLKKYEEKLICLFTKEQLWAHKMSGHISVKRKTYDERLMIELDVIGDYGLGDYFVLIEKIVRWAKGNNIQVAPGRGSIAGSLVAYVLEITEIEPIEHNLLFERFLNPGRKTVPDIDIDFDSERRDEVMKYVADNWNTAKISTYITLKGKGAYKDVSRVFDYSFKETNALTKLWSNDLSIEGAVLNNNVSQGERFKIAREFVGRIRSQGVHPAGVIVVDKNYQLTNRVPIEYDKKNDCYVSQYDMHDVEEVGLLKVDLLATKTQTILSMLKVRTQTFDLSVIGEPSSLFVYKAFCCGTSFDVFQFQSVLAVSALKKVKPNNFNDLVAVTALIRPGAMDFIDEYASFSRVDFYLNVEIKKILSSTRGIILFQEQVMELAVTVSGFSMLEADDFRQAIGKKDVELMYRLRNRFIDGGVDNGYEKKIMMQLFDEIEKSSSYLFNRAHAVAYTLTSYYCMWFKVQHPIVWYSVVLTVYMDDKDKIRRYISEIRSRGVELLCPSVKMPYLQYDFSFKGNSIVFGLGAIKHVSKRIVDIIKDYQEFEPYDSFYNFYVRVTQKGVNKDSMLMLIYSGACDCFGKSRSYMCKIVEDIGVDQLRKSGVTEIEKILSGDNVMDSDYEKSVYEKQSLGFSVSKTIDKIYSGFLKSKGFDLKTFIRKQKRNIVDVFGIVYKISEKNREKGTVGVLILDEPIYRQIYVYGDLWQWIKKKMKSGDGVVVTCYKKGDRLSVDQKRGGKVEWLEKKKMMLE